MEDSVAVGGKEQRRGAMYQDCSQLLYVLTRLIDHPNLEIIVESVEDATILYKVQDEDIVELVQCKKREVKEGGPAYAGINERDPWIAGTFNINDLQEWILPVREGVSTASLLEQNENYLYTSLVFGQLTKPLAAFVPEGLKELMPLRYPSASFSESFPVSYRHTKEPVNAPKSRFATEDVRKRIRVISTVSPTELQVMCIIMLTDPELYGVSTHKVEITLNRLFRKFWEAATVKGKISGHEILEIISAGKLEHGLWQKAEVLLDEGNPAVADPNRGEPPRWIDFNADRFADRPEFASVWNEIATPGAFVAVNGAVGTGKTTLVKYLMQRFLTARVENRAYYLLVSPTTSLSDEINFLTQNIHADTLFVVDDEHLAVAEVAGLVEAFVDFKTSGNARARLIVTSKINYGRAEGLAQGHKAKQLRQAIHIPLSNNSPEIVEQIVGQLRTKAGLTSTLSNRELASLSDGVLGLALLIAQSHRHSTGGQTKDEIVARDKLKTQLAKWISSHVPNVASQSDFENQLAPIFILSAFGLPVPELYSPHVAPLQTAGFLEPFSTTDPHSFRAANLNLAFIIQAQFKFDHFKILSNYIDRYVAYLPQVFVRVAEWKESQQTLEELSKAKFKLISQQISDQSYGLSLSNVTNILRATRSVSRGTSIKLLADWISPNRQANKWFFRDAVSRATSASELAGFFGVIYQIDQHLGVLKELAQSQFGLLPYERDQILLLFSRPSCQLDQIAVCLHEIKRLASDFAVRLYEHFKTTQVFDQKVAEIEANERSLSIWLRYCEELKPVNRSDAYETLEKFLSPDKVIGAALVKSTTLNPISVFLLRLRRLHPRWAADILSTLWKDHQEQVERLLRRENDLDTLTQDLYSFSQVNRIIAIQVSFRILDRIVVLLRAEEQYKIVGAKIETFRKFISAGIASELCESIEKKRMLELIQSERRYADLVGKFLFDLSQASFTTAAWFEERLSYQELLRIARTPKLRDLAIVARGFLSAASFKRREVLRDQMLNDARLRSSFRKRWDEANTLSELGFCLVALTSCPLKGDEIERLLNFSNRAAIADDIYRRFANTTNTLHIGNGLYGVARFDSRIARQALQIYVDHIVDEIKKSRKLQEDGPREKRGQTSSSSLSLNRNIVEQGCLFQISAAVNLNDARRLIELVAPSGLSQMCLEEANLGRITVFLSGLRQASRHYATSVLAAISSEEQWQKQLDENEEIENIIHYARVVNLISRPTGRQFTRFLFERLGAEINGFLKIEANVLLISNWLRILANAGENYIQEHGETLAPLMIDAVKYDRRIWHLLEGAEAQVDTGRIDLAKKLADEILAESRQISSVRSLHDLIVLINKAIHLERGAHVSGFSESLTKSIEDWHISIMISTERQYILSAYSYYLFNHDPVLSSNHLKSAVLNKRTPLIDALELESPSISKVISLTLCDAPHTQIVEVVNNMDWRRAQTWELGLSTLLFDAIHGPKGLSSPLYTLDSSAKEVLSRGLNRHAGNLEFALSLYLARSLKMPADYLSSLESEAASRAEDESSAATRWLLHHTEDVSVLSKLPYYIWVYLKDTLLRPTYLPWEKDVEVIADSIAFKQDYFRDLPSLAGA